MEILELKTSGEKLSGLNSKTEGTEQRECEREDHSAEMIQAAVQREVFHMSQASEIYGTMSKGWTCL